MIGPFLRWTPRIVAFVVLTIISQVGGLCYALALFSRSRLFPATNHPIAVSALLFTALYAITWAPVGWLSNLSGRTALPCSAIASATLSASAITCALHRHYASREMTALALALSEAVDRRFPRTTTVALDGNFPFLDGFPLLPHLSHDDGEKLDIAFYYRTRNGDYARGQTRSPIGYWAFETPRAGETPACTAHQDGLRWDMRWLQPIMRDDLELDEPRTRYALRWLASEGPRRGLGKVFVEPHLARRLGARGEVIRFQGCRAARHDDHIHLQLR